MMEEDEEEADATPSTFTTTTTTPAIDFSDSVWSPIEVALIGVVAVAFVILAVKRIIDNATAD